MNIIILTLIKLGILKMSVQIISMWINAHFVQGILYALKKGEKHIRILAIEGLGNLGHREFVSLLEEKIKSPFMNESWEAIKSYKKVCTKYNISIPKETQNLITESLKKYEEYLEYIKKHTSGNFQYGYTSAHTNTVNILKDNQMGVFPYGT